MIKCLIIEDEIAGQTILKKKIDKFFPQCELLGIIDNKDEAEDFLCHNQVDLVFLDMHLKGGLGIDIFETCKHKGFETIVITAFKEYAIDALNNGATYYLLKPFHDDEFKKGIDLAIKRITKTVEDDTILIANNNSQTSVAISKILYLQSEGAYTLITIEDQSKILSSRNLGYYEQLLPNFIRTHHSYIVNPKKIVVLTSGRSGEITMENGDIVPVSQRKKAEVASKLNL